ncbi:hypothetical protein LXL04_016146 [Taraxacum kok-saghyz]
MEGRRSISRLKENWKSKFNNTSKAPLNVDLDDDFVTLQRGAEDVEMVVEPNVDEHDEELVDVNVKEGITRKRKEMKKDVVAGEKCRHAGAVRAENKWSCEMEKNRLKFSKLWLELYDDLELRSFENSYILENPRTPKPLTFSTNRLREAKNRSNTSPFLEKKIAFSDFFFATGFVFERFLASRSRFFEKVNGLGVLGFSGIYEFSKYTNSGDVILLGFLA